MKKFFMITPLQPVTWDEVTGEITKDQLHSNIYQAEGNSRLIYDYSTRFPLISTFPTS